MIRPRDRRNPNGKPGLLPHVVTIVLKDFINARASNPEVPKDANELCATQSVTRIVQAGDIMGAHFYDLMFDQNEPFMGHILDRKNNHKARKHLKPITDKITTIAQTDMRNVPALQMADLFAWCYSHKNMRPRFKWQNRLLNNRRWVDEWIEYETLIKIIPGVAATVKSWRLPPRRPTR